MPTPLTGITTPTYGPGTWDTLASMAASLEALGVVVFDTEADRDAAIPNPTEGRVCYVTGATGGVSVYTATGWQYLAFRPVVP